MAGDPARSTETGPADDPSFEIPARPERRFPYDEGVTYEGSTVFVLTPVESLESETLAATVETALSSGPYRYGDYYDLPMPVYLVRDGETADVFRVSVRDGRVRLHVLPATGSDGLQAFYERLRERTQTAWRVDCHVED